MGSVRSVAAIPSRFVHHKVLCCRNLGDARREFFQMASFLIARSFRRLQKPSRLSSSSSSSLYLCPSLNSLSSSPIPTPNLNPNLKPNYCNPFRQYYRLNPIFEFPRENFKLNWDFRSVAHISTSVRESEEDKGGSRPLKAEVSWIDLYLPKQARPYARLARLDKPIGTWLLAWPCMWYDCFTLFLFFPSFLVFLCVCVFFYILRITWELARSLTVNILNLINWW